MATHFGSRFIVSC